MAVRKIKVTLNTEPNSDDCGKFSTEAEGYFGKGCAADLAFFEQLGTVGKSTRKPEYRTIQRNVVTGRQ